MDIVKVVGANKGCGERSWGVWGLVSWTSALFRVVGGDKESDGQAGSGDC